MLISMLTYPNLFHIPDLIPNLTLTLPTPCPRSGGRVTLEHA